MIHAAARSEPYTCFVRPDTRIPFMAMPDAISALLDLAKAPRESLTRTAYNLTAFSPTAQQIHDAVIAAFPGAVVHWGTDEKRQSIVDSWPEDVDDGAARRDWGFCTDVRFQFCVRAISDSERPGALSMRRVHAMSACLAVLMVAPGYRHMGVVSGTVFPTTLYAAENDSMNALAERYVKLVLALGQHDRGLCGRLLRAAGVAEGGGSGQRRTLADIDRDAAATARLRWLRRGPATLRRKRCGSGMSI